LGVGLTTLPCKKIVEKLGCGANEKKKNAVFRFPKKT
jgi:hypothetical protein